MSYVALYRKFRPRTFSQVKGQDHIVRTLTNQIKNNRIGHAYLFTGTRGTGKTSVAKILAKAANCLSPKEGEPCCECENCLAAAQGSFLDMVEIDAASNTGVEDIRRVIEEVQYTPARGRFKVYIIDEVHMLSVNAFNAFLKTLEEPPEYVIFILATTEPHKLPATILSRCQRYDFKRISLETIAENINELLSQEGVQAEEKAVRYVARLGDGSMRDALSLMDRCMAFSTDGVITYEKVLSVLGTVDMEDYSALFQAINRYDVTGALQVIEHTVDSGKDLTPFISDFLMYLRNLLILNVGGKSAEELLGLSEENLSLLSKDASQADSEALMRWIRILSDLLNQLRFSPSKQILAEVAVIKLARPEMETGTENLADRVRRLEQRLSETAVPSAAPERGLHAAAPTPAPSAEPVVEEPYIYNTEEDPYADPEEAFSPEITYIPEMEPDFSMEGPESVAVDVGTPEIAVPAAEPVFSGNGAATDVCSRWQEVVNACGERRLRTYLTKARVKAEGGDRIALSVTGEMALRQLREETAIEYIRQLIRDVCGAQVELFVRQEQPEPEIPNQTDISSLLKNINMNIETEDA